MCICLQRDFSYHFTSRENSGGPRHLLDLGLFFSSSFCLSLFSFSFFFLIYTSENGFWLWAYRRMGNYVGSSSIMNNCILHGFWRFRCLSRCDLVIIMAMYVWCCFSIRRLPWRHVRVFFFFRNLLWPRASPCYELKEIMLPVISRRMRETCCDSFAVAVLIKDWLHHQLDEVVRLRVKKVQQKCQK